MIEKIIMIYIGSAISICLHELAHYFVGLSVGIKSANLYIGEEFFRINIGKIHFSPLIYGGYVEFDSDIYMISQKGLAATFFCGATVNIVIAVVAIVCAAIEGMNIVLSFIIYTNIIMGIMSVVPVRIIKNDYCEYRRIITKKQNSQKEVHKKSTPLINL